MTFIGDENSLLIFKAAGCSTYPVKDSDQARDVLDKLNTEENHIIFINEEWAEELGEQLAKLREKGIAVTAIPGIRGSKGKASDLIKKIAKRARGVESSDE